MSADDAPPFPFDFGEAERRCADALIELALAEDLGEGGDVTSLATIPPEALGLGDFVARAPGVVCGLPVVALIAERFGLDAGSLRLALEDGERVERGTRIASISGPLRSILAIERTALNFLQRLSGVASMTAHFVAAVAWNPAVVLDTRKTTPGWRGLEKYAVRRGGGRNHRIGLYDGVLIKDNHLAAMASRGEADPIAQAIASARSQAPPGTPIEIEVDSLGQLERALACGPEIILLDNFGLESLAAAVRLRDERARAIALEASGGVNLQTVAAIARTGVDRISVGALTHSAPSLDIALEIEQTAMPSTSSPGGPPSGSRLKAGPPRPSKGSPDHPKG